MKGISLYRQVNVEDITELTPRKGAHSVSIQINKPPRLEDVDNKISQLVDVLMVLEQNLDDLEKEYFLDVNLASNPQPELAEAPADRAGAEFDEEITDKDEEYESLLKKLNIS